MEKTIKYTLTHYGEEIEQADSLNGVFLKLYRYEDNLHYALANGSYKIFKRGEEMQSSHETLNTFIKTHEKNLYFECVSKIKDIIEALGWQVIGEDKENIFIHNIWINVQSLQGKIAFRASINNTGKTTFSVSPYFERDNQGKYITPYEYDENHLSIHVSIKKDVEKAVKDIKRRFIPLYIELMKKQTKLLEKSNNYFNNTLKNKEILKGGPLADHEKKGDSLYLANKNISRADVSGDKVWIALYSLTVEQAQKVIEALS